MNDQPKLAEEIKRMAHDPWLPIETKLIAWSLGLGTALLGLLIWLSYRFFPG